MNASDCAAGYGQHHASHIHLAVWACIFNSTPLAVRDRSVPFISSGYARIAPTLQRDSRQTVVFDLPLSFSRNSLSEDLYPVPLPAIPTVSRTCSPVISMKVKPGRATLAECPGISLDSAKNKNIKSVKVSSEFRGGFCTELHP